MRAAESRPQVQVKASGGIRTLDALLEMRAAGATRVGSSSTEKILEECKKRLGPTAERVGSR
jgi:deoxyribose-phosphate aldolase